jgi:hypothetical protein
VGPLARNRAHRLAAYAQCSAGAGVSVPWLARCVSAVLALVCVGCASAPRRAPSSADIWERLGCFSHVVSESREVDSSILEGTVFTAGYRPSEFPVPVAVLYARRLPDSKVLTVEVDAEGRFAVPDLAEGQYEIGVCANGWKPWRGRVRIHRDGPKGGLALPLELGG